MKLNKIAFIPHPTRGREIIKIFESRGFRNPMNYDGAPLDDKYLNDIAYIGGCDGAKDCILVDNVDYLRRVGYKIYTLEEWEERSNMKITILDGTISALTAKDRGYIDEIIKVLTNYGAEKMISYHEEIEFLKRIRIM